MRRPPLALLASLAVGAVLADAGPAAAQPKSRVTEYSPYEKEAIASALAKRHAKIDPAPEGKVIRHIETERLEVLEPRDPGPELLKPVPILSPIGKYVTKPMLNWLHVRSKDWVIRRALLLHEGDRYMQVLIDETARNMRATMPLQVSLVVIVPIETDEPGTVDVLVITKDIWSLRLSFDLAVTPGGLENFILVPQETNFLGLHHTASTRLQLQPETLTLGIGYKVPRFGTSWIGAGVSASVFVNRRSGQPEGSNIGVSVGQPLYSTRTDWSWETDAGYTVGVARRYSNAHVFLFDSRTTPQVRDNIPFQYHSRSISAAAGLTRSFGWAVKNNFTLSFNANASEYETFDLSRYPKAAADDFRGRALPTSESRVYPSLGWHLYTPDYLRTLDVNTLALQEDFRLGPDVSAAVYPVSKALGSSRDLVGFTAKGGYALALGDGIVGASMSTFAENSGGSITDASVGGAFGVATPRIFGLGRIVMNTSFSNRYRNYLNYRSFIGGDDRLRGYPTSFFFGKDTVFYNIEYRSRALEILKAQVGGVLFFDAGDAFDARHAFPKQSFFDTLHAKQSVGFGVRALFPQVNRNVFRLDIAFPLKRGPFPETGSPVPVDPFGFYFSFDQAFGP